MPNRYGANFHAESYRSSRPANRVAFQAASDGDAATVAAELGNWTQGRLTSLSAIFAGTTPAKPYPVGTRRTCTAIVTDTAGGVYKVRFRNCLTTLTADDVTALLLGVVGATGIGATLTALSGPPAIPSSGLAIVAVNAVTFTTKS